MKKHRFSTAPVPQAVRRQLLAWHDRERRPYPWRVKPTPYRIWVAEIMLQQTVVTAVVPFFERFVRRFPTVQRLARASQDEVLRAWEGLGYYSRARHLHLAAKTIVEEFDGTLPEKYDQLLGLPGIGEYTAAAIMSIAYGKPFPAVDANVRRVVGRLLGADSRQSTGVKEISTFLEKAISPRRPGVFNEALMELGQTICRVRDPRCGECPLSSHCSAFTEALTNATSKAAPVAVTRVSSWQFIIMTGDNVLLEQRNGGRFRGLWIFPRLARDEQTPLPLLLKRELGIRIANAQRLKSSVHRYTRFAEELTPVVVNLKSGPRCNSTALKWQPLSQVEELPMNSFDRKVWREVLKSATAQR